MQYYGRNNASRLYERPAEDKTKRNNGQKAKVAKHNVELIRKHPYWYMNN